MNDAVATEVMERYLREQRLRVWVRSCLSKCRYHTEHDARCVAQKSLRRRKVVLRAYACEHCRGWHLTKHIDPRTSA